jgi:hypothetical protein
MARRTCYRLGSSTELPRRPNTGGSLRPETRLTRARVPRSKNIDVEASKADKTRLMIPELGMSCILPVKE